MHDCLALAATRECSISLINRTAFLSSPKIAPGFPCSVLCPPYHALDPLAFLSFFSPYPLTRNAVTAILPSMDMETDTPTEGRIMADTKHTPGPWKVKGLTIWANREDGSSIGVVANASTGDDDKADRHNARLIAAAPEMLDALKDLLKCQASDGTKCAPNDEDLEQARAAIEHAEEGNERKRHNKTQQERYQTEAGDHSDMCDTPCAGCGGDHAYQHCGS